MAVPRRFQLAETPSAGPADAPRELSDDERRRAVEEFIAQVGGSQNAAEALAMLTLLDAVRRRRPSNH
jgi:hypothetical protein